MVDKVVLVSLFFSPSILLFVCSSVVGTEEIGTVLDFMSPTLDN